MGVRREAGLSDALSLLGLSLGDGVLALGEGLSLPECFAAVLSLLQLTFNALRVWCKCKWKPVKFDWALSV